MIERIKKMTRANRITASRMIFCPITFFTIMNCFSGNKIAMIIALIVAVISELMDVFDGRVARRYNEESKIGKLLDPLSDFYWHSTVYICLIIIKLASPWLFFVMLTREIAVIVIRNKTLMAGDILTARPWGKIKCHFIAWYAAIMMLLYIFKLYNVCDFTSTFLYAQILVGLVIAYSCFDYFRSTKKNVIDPLLDPVSKEIAPSEPSIS